MRQAQGLAPRQRRSDWPLPTVTEAPHRRLTPRRATWLVLRPSERLTAPDHQQLAQLTTQAPELAEAVALAQDFTALVRQRQPAQLDPWLARAATSTLPPFRRFARGLRADYTAVQAAVTLPWSQGPIEGHINRLKMLKRQMFGRARLDLLARRFLLTACPTAGPPPCRSCTDTRMASSPFITKSGQEPRYIHQYQLVERSAYVPRCDREPPIPEWKRRPEVRDLLPANDPARPLVSEGQE